MELKELNRLIEKLSVLKNKKQDISDELKETNEEIRVVEEAVSTVLVENNLDKFASPSGTAYHSVHLSTSITDKKVFHNWLKENGYYDDIVSVNSQTLKAFIKSLKTDDTVNPEVPGIEINDFVKLNFRRN